MEEDVSDDIMASTLDVQKWSPVEPAALSQAGMWSIQLITRNSEFV